MYVCLYFLSLQIVFEGVWGNNRVSGYLALDDVTFFDGDCDSKNFKHFIKASRRKMGSLPIKIQACCTNNGSSHLNSVNCKHVYVQFRTIHFAYIISCSLTRGSNSSWVYVWSRFLLLEKHFDWRFRMEDGNLGQEAGKSARQDLRCPRRLRLLWHFQHRKQVYPWMS